MITNWDELPLILKPENIQEIMKGDNEKAPAIESVRALMHAKDFPLIEGFKELRVSKDALKQYFIRLKNE